MAAVVLGGGRDTEEAAAVGRSANYARATDGAALPRAELSSLMTAEVIVNIRISYNVCCVCVMCCGCGMCMSCSETVALSQHPLHRSIITSVGHALSPRQC